MELTDLYRDLFEKHCWYHQDYALPTLHLILGQLPEIKKIKVYYQSSTHYIDLRFHFCYIAPTGTGKGAGANFVNEICKRLGLNLQSLTTATDAGLIGKPERIIQYNPKTKSMEPFIIVEKGLLHPDKKVNILLYPEAGVLFRHTSNAYVQDQCNYFQITMNPLGSQDNKLVKRLAMDYLIEFNPECSLFFTTYEPEGLFSTLINRGLLQRMYFIVNNISDDLRVKMVEQSILNISDSTNKKIRDEVEQKKGVLVDKLKFINEFARGIVEMEQDSNVVESFKTLVKLMLDSTMDCQPTIREQLFKFIQRYFEIAYKLSVHHALMRGDTKINSSDVVYSKDLMMASWKRLQTLMEMRYYPDSPIVKRNMLHDKAVLECIDMKIAENKSVGVTFAELKSIVNDKLGYSSLGAIQYIRGLESKGYIVKVDGTNIYKPTGKKVVIN